MKDDRVDLAQFVRIMFTAGPVERFDLLRVELVGMRRVASWSADQLKDKDHATVANLIWNSAEEHTKQIGGTVRWAAAAYMSMAPGIMGGRVVFRMSSEEGSHA